MKNIVNLIKSAYGFRKYTKKCLRHETASTEYVLAKHYKDYFEGIEDEAVTVSQLDALGQEVSEKQRAYQSSDDIQQLLSSLLGFMDALKLVVK